VLCCGAALKTNVHEPSSQEATRRLLDYMFLHRTDRDAREVVIIVNCEGRV